MIRHLNAWARLRQEIDDTGLRDGVMAYADASQLPYIQACIKETLRIFHPVSPRIYRGVLSPTCDLLICLKQFSGGIGACVGQHLARIALNKILATIVRDYDIRQVDPKQKWTYSAYFIVVPRDWPVYIEKRKR